METETNGLEIAVIGISGRFPGGNNLEEFWEKITQGVELTTIFCEATDNSNSENKKIKAGSILKDIEQFDAGFFGFNPREAAAMDPQHRLFLECAWEALENAGYDSSREKRPIGVFAGVGMSTYWLFNLYPHEDFVMTDIQNIIGIDKDYVSTLASYKLNLTGPSISMGTACSSSLVSIHLACQSLLAGECDMALAAGIAVKFPQNENTLCPTEIISSDGHCRAFDAQAKGIVGGNGIGVVMLKRLEDAIEDGDCIHAVIKGSAINNDGDLKVGYTAPSPQGLTKVIRSAHLMAEVDPETITYVQTHGTGTPLGDPIEIASMTEAFRYGTDKKGYCAITSVKTNIGHLDAAAGIMGLIQTILALKHKLIPPSINFESPNPQINFDNSPFYVNTELKEWQTNNSKRRAGVSSFGIGGTNVHIILEEAPDKKTNTTCESPQLLLFSAKTSSALETTTTNLGNYFTQNTDLNLADVAYTLQIGRRKFNHRRAFVAQNLKDATTVLQSIDPQRIFTKFQEESGDPSIFFMFSGQGSQYVNMSKELYQKEIIFQEEINHCCQLLKPHLGLDLQQIIYPQEENIETAAEKLKQTAICQPALFVIEYALAKLLMSWGIRPQATIGHSIGEYVAATLADVFSLEDALALVVKRGQLMQQMPTGIMLSVGLSPEELQPLLNPEISLATHNAPSLSVVAGSIAAIEEFQNNLVKKGINCRYLHTSHAFHSPMMDSIVPIFTKEVEKLKLNSPSIPFISNITGKWITESQAIDPNYWGKHLRQPVLFSQGVTELLKEKQSIFLEVGPGTALTTMIRQHKNDKVVLSSMRHPKNEKSDQVFLLETLGKLWLEGVEIDWDGFYRDKKPNRIPLPTYPFERQRYWIDPPQNSNGVKRKRKLEITKNIEDFFYTPSWKRSAKQLKNLEDKPYYWLIFCDECGLGSSLSKELSRRERDTVIQVFAGEEFINHQNSSLDGLNSGKHEYTINPSKPEDYDLLVKELAELEEFPIISHFWSVNQGQSLEKYQELGFWSLVYLTQSLDKNHVNTDIKMSIVSNNVQEVTGEEKICPEKTTILGACKVIPQEYLNIKCRNIDIIIPENELLSDNKLVHQLIKELATESTEAVVAYRGYHRWIQTLEATPLEEVNSNETRWRQEGVYCIIGGLGGIGGAIAEYLAQSIQPKLVLIGRSDLPPKHEWNNLLTTLNSDNSLIQKIKKLQTLERLGAEVLAIKADITNQQEMTLAINQIYEKFGDLHGIIHAAGITGQGTFQSKTPEMVADVFAPKVKGTLVLDSVIKDLNLDFLVLFSSISSIIGGLGGIIDYSAANAFLDGFAYLKRNYFTVAIDWDVWKEVGMATNNPAMDKFKQYHKEIFDKGITIKEGLEAFNRILSQDISQIIVTKRNLNVNLDQNLGFNSRNEKEITKENEIKSTFPRPSLANPYVAPRNENEEKLTKIWQELLGIDQVGIYDNFFELGGHSLLATQINSRLEEIFQIRLSMTEIFDKQTIAELAQTIEKTNNNLDESDELNIEAVDREAYRMNL